MSVSYKTGEVAKILGISNLRKIRQMIDSGIIKGRIINGKDGRGRRSYRVVSRCALIKYVEEKGNAKSQKWLLGLRTEVVKDLILKEGQQGGVLFKFKGLAGNLIAIIKNLDPLEKLDGRSEDKRRVEIFEKLIKIMQFHVQLREKIAVLKNKRKAG